MNSIYILHITMTSMEIVIGLKINLVRYILSNYHWLSNGPENVAKKDPIQFLGLLGGNLSNDEILGLFSSKYWFLLVGIRNFEFTLFFMTLWSTYIPRFQREISLTYFSVCLISTLFLDYTYLIYLPWHAYSLHLDHQKKAWQIGA